MTVAMEAVTKSVEAAVRPVDSENPNGEFVLILSKDNADRDDENLWAYEWMEPLPAKIHMDTDHAFAKGMSVPLTAGSGVPEISEDGELLVKGGYAGTPHGQLTRQLVKEGHIWQASVSYQLRELSDGRIVRELLNGTFTGVPCNPEAVVLSSKSNNALEHATYQKADAPLTPGTHHADPGYLDRNGDPAKGGNGVPRYQLDDASHVRNALARFSQNGAEAKYTASQRSAVLGRIRSAARKFGIGVSDKGGEKALVVALCKAISLSKDHGPNTPAGTAFVDDVGAHSVYDPSDDEDHAEDDENQEGDVAQAIHDAAIALGAACKHADHEHSTLSSLEASLKSIVQPVIRGYNIVVAGPPGQELFTLNKGDTVVGHGKLGDLTEAAETKDIQPDADDNPASLAAALDATLDQAVALVRGADLSSLPTNVAQAYALACAAETTVDELLKVMNVYDADDADEASEPADSDSDDNPAALAGSLDALLDEAGTLINGVDLSTLPENAAKMCALLVAAETIVDELLDAMGVYDPSDSATVKSVDVNHADVNASTDGKPKSAEQAAAASGASPDEIQAAADEKHQHKAVAVAEPDTSDNPEMTADDSVDSPPETLPKSADEKATAAADTKAAAAAVSPADLAVRAKARLRNFQFNNETTVIETETV